MSSSNVNIINNMKIQSSNLNLYAAICVAIVFFALSILIASAHGAGGTIEVEQDGYLIDVGYSEEEIVTGAPTQLSFLLFEILENATNEEVLFSNVWVRLEHKENIVFAGLLGRPEFGDTSMSFSFAESGEYDLFVRYKNEETTLVERTLKLSVQEGERGSSLTSQTSDASSRVLVLVSAASFLLAVIIFGFFPPLLKGIKRIRDYVLKQCKKCTSVTQSKPAARSQAAPESSKGPASGVVLATYIAVGLLISIATFLITSFLLGTISLPDWQGFSNVSESNGEVVRVVLTETGYEPSDLVIERGTTVEFSTTAGRPHWPASNLHPSHTEYSEFDPLQPVEPDQTWSFTFNDVGEWGFHDHLRSYFSGKITVQPVR
jgi:plastocyanin